VSASLRSSQAPPSVERAAAELDVLTVIDHLSLGGAEMLLGQFAAAAPRAGIRLRVAHFEGPVDGPAAGPLRAAGIEPAHLDVDGRPGGRHLRAMREHIRLVEPDIVHTHLGTADLIGGLAARSLGVPVLSTIHSIASRSKGGQRARSALFALGRRCCDARVIAVSECARRAYVQQSWGMGERVVMIYNGVDIRPQPGDGADVRRELGIAPEDQLVGMVSALRPEKAHDVAIEAIAQLRARHPRLRLLIVGAGPLDCELERLAAPLGEAVVFAGRRTDIPRVLDALDVCLHPSRMDAFPTTLIEALATSTPVLATSVGGVPEIIDDGRTGVLIPGPPRAEEIAAALEPLLADPGRRRTLAATGRGAYEQRFTAEPWVRSTRALYDTMLAEARTGRSARRTR
jgi:glycosyltransferase involved in cell wall biosynthesis